MVIQAKINSQIRTLEHLRADATGLLRLPPRVLSGDTSNIEALAARLYWGKLFGACFRRRQDEPGLNGLLNYGYAILRSAIARAIVGAGLHPSLGIHHSNQYNPFALADDLMEPFRPCVDLLVHEAANLFMADEQPSLTKDVRAILLSLLSRAIVIDDRQEPMLNVTHHYICAFRESLFSEKPQLPKLGCFV